MNSEQARRPENLVQTDDSRWPTCSMLMWGTFGTKTPAERRYLSRAIAAATVTIACTLVFALSVRLRWNTPVTRTLMLLVVGASLTYIAWEFGRYLHQLDGLARRMQLEAMAWTYITGMVLAAWMGALLTFSHALQHWVFSEKVFLLLIPFLYFLLEPVRAGWLYYLSRKY